MQTHNDLFITLCGLIHSGHAHTPNYTAWATAELVAGRDTPRLRVLAGFPDDATSWEVVPEFERTVEELGWTFPSEQEALFLYAQQIAQSLLDGTRTAYEVSSILAGCHYHDFDNDFYIWSELYEAIDDITRFGDAVSYRLNGATLDTLAEEARQAARELLAKDFAEVFPDHAT